MPDMKNFPTYKSDGEPAQFVSILQGKLEMYNVPLSKYTTILRECIEDKDVARRNWVQSEIIDKNLPWGGSNGAKQVFCSQYALPGLTVRKHAELSDMKQGKNETVAKFVDRLRTLLNFMGVNMKEHSLILQVMMKFRPDIQARLREYQVHKSADGPGYLYDNEYIFPDLETLFRIALMYDNMNASNEIIMKHRAPQQATTTTDGESKKPSRRSKNNKRARSDSQPQEEADPNQPAPPRKSKKNKKNKQQKRSSSTGPSPGPQSTTFTGTCNRCGKTGHKQRECYSRYDMDGNQLPDNHVRAATLTNTPQASPPGQPMNPRSDGGKKPDNSTVFIRPTFPKQDGRSGNNQDGGDGNQKMNPFQTIQAS